MDFSMSPQQKMVRDEVARLVKEIVIPRARENDRTGAIPDDALQKAWELGASVSMAPEEFGGFGNPDSPVESAIILEELAYGEMAFAMAATAPSLFIHPVAEMGTPAQKKKYLPLYCRDTFTAGAMAVNEPHYGFDAADLKTTAAKKNGAYVLNGEKCFVPLAKKAGHLLVAATLDGKNNLFIVGADNPGMTVGDRETNLGTYALETHPVTLNNCEIPAEDRLGGESGCDFGRVLQKCRTAMSAMATGVARAAFDHARQYAVDRHQFGEPIACRQSIAFMVAEMAYEVEAMRFLTWKAASRLEAGRDARREAYLARLYAGEKAMLIADYGVQIYGGHGYIREYPMERFYRDARGVSILEGMATL
jgi:alkylation response protein AidB-like acyl-CoA dehydrogenase